MFTLNRNRLLGFAVAVLSSPSLPSISLHEQMNLYSTWAPLGLMSQF